MSDYVYMSGPIFAVVWPQSRWLPAPARSRPETVRAGIEAFSPGATPTAGG